MTPAEKMAARLAGTTPVTVHELPPQPEANFDRSSEETRIRSKQARHALQQKAREAAAKTERKAEADPAEKPAEPEAKQDEKPAPQRDDSRNRDQRRDRR